MSLAPDDAADEVLGGTQPDATEGTWEGTREGDQELTTLVRRGGPVLRPDPSRTVLRPFIPGRELVTLGVSRAEAVIHRVLDLPEDVVASTLRRVVESVSRRHPDAARTFRDHVDHVSSSLPSRDGVSQQRLELLGAYLTQEYAVEAAAILNPSIVPHPDQTGVAAGSLRFVLSMRAVGEGHISSLEFRTGVVDAGGQVLLDDPGHHLVRPVVSVRALPVAYLQRLVGERGAAWPAQVSPATADGELTVDEVADVVAQLDADDGVPDDDVASVRAAVDASYRAQFAAGTELGGRVLFPASAAERHGIEDARLVRSEQGDYLGTYTAYDGATIASHLLRTRDFETFDVLRLLGPSARDKGMALFPRAIRGRLHSMARRDRETLVVSRSPDGIWWDDSVPVQLPRRPWELVQLGTCAPPIETPDGWLVITHGVGPVREYALGAMLLDLHEPTRVLGVLPEPLLVPDEVERVGYVPNVVYACGALLHDGTVVLPYGCSDSAVRFATVELDPLLGRLLGPGS